VDRPATRHNRRTRQQLSHSVQSCVPVTDDRVGRLHGGTQNPIGTREGSADLRPTYPTPAEPLARTRAFANKFGTSQCWRSRPAAGLGVRIGSSGSWCRRQTHNAFWLPPRHAAAGGVAQRCNERSSAARQRDAAVSPSAVDTGVTDWSGGSALRMEPTPRGRSSVLTLCRTIRGDENQRPPLVTSPSPRRSAAASTNHSYDPDLGLVVAQSVPTDLYEACSLLRDGRRPRCRAGTGSFVVVSD
jgi:hypothetical protein